MRYKKLIKTIKIIIFLLRTNDFYLIFNIIYIKYINYIIYSLYYEISIYY